MPSKDTPIKSIRWAAKENGSRPNEDRFFQTQNAVIILDGASQPEATEHNGGWFASELGEDLQSRLTENDIHLAEALETSIASIAIKYDLIPCASPSSTVAIVRWSQTNLDVLVLGDSTVLIGAPNGAIQILTDNRLSEITKNQSQRPKGFRHNNPEYWRDLLAAQRKARNLPGGYWIAEAIPKAAKHAVQASFSLGDISSVMVMTDGVSVGVERYNMPENWLEALKIAQEDPAALVDLVHNTELSDEKGQKWPRSKLHDDKTLVTINFCK